MAAQDAYAEETEHLVETMQNIAAQLGEIGPRYKGNDFTEQMLDLQQEERRKRLDIASREPYFGRIDFQELLEGASSAQGEPKPLYIGKAGVAKKGSDELLVIDWRAPAASMFYSFTGGDSPAMYDAPDGEVSGYIYLKRNFMIRQGELVRLVDSYVRGQEEGAVTDEFLLYRLGENKDHKLRDIVSTIQGEQDQIIRAERSKALFVQGVAGSGKTTVALHRLAFLIYQYEGKMRAERMMIFAPNRMFLDYISGVLPELGVGDIGQTTFRDWAVKLLEHSVVVADPSATLMHWFEERRTAEELEQASGRWKGSLAFKSAIDERLAQFEERLVPTTAFAPIDGLELMPDQMRAWFETDYGDEPLMKKRERLVSRIRRWFESELKMKGIADKKIRSKALTRFNAFVKKIPSYTAVQLYTSMFHGKLALAGVPKLLAKETAERLNSGVAAEEDLAALVYIQLQLFGMQQPSFDHIVIDEAQDYSPFQLTVLQQCQRTTSMTVLGDLQQGIHGYTGIHAWSELTGLFNADTVGFFELNRSYRSTMEIIEFSNYILGEMTGDVQPAVAVFRSGDPIEIERVAKEQWLAVIAATIREWQSMGSFETISVIGRTANECAEIHQYVSGLGIEASLVQSKQPAYGGGLSIVPVYLSKGLEFDAVLVADAGEDRYNHLDAKLLYVGCTRALHKLKLLHRGRLTPLLAEWSS